MLMPAPVKTSGGPEPRYAASCATWVGDADTPSVCRASGSSSGWPITLHYGCPMIDAAGLRVMRAIADEGSFTSAAASLGYSQPAISQMVRRLEQRVGTPLVDRVGRTVRLTEAGHALARHAGTVLAALDAARKRSRRLLACAPDESACPLSRPRPRLWCPRRWLWCVIAFPGCQ